MLRKFLAVILAAAFFGGAPFAASAQTAYNLGQGVASPNTWSALQTFSAGLTVSGGTVTLGSGSGPARLSSGVVGVGSTVLTSEVSGILPSANGGTGNGFTKFSGPATSEKTFTLPNASDTIATLGVANTWTAIQTFGAGFGVSIAGPFVLTLENTATTQNGILRFKNTAGSVDIGRNITIGNGAFEVYNGSPLFIVLDSGKAGFNTSALNIASGFHVGGSAAIGSGYAGITAPTNGLLVQGLVGFGTNSPNEGLEMGTGLNIRIPNIKSTSGVRYVCVNTSGTLVSQAAACSGT